MPFWGKVRRGRRVGVVYAAWPELATMACDVLGQPVVVATDSERSAPGRRVILNGVWQARLWLSSARHAQKIWARLGGEREVDNEKSVRLRSRLARVRAAIFCPGSSASERAAASEELDGMSGLRGVARVKRAISNQAIEEGLKADGRGRWRVLAVTAWRGSARGREGLVTWAGPHAPSWVPTKSLSMDLREGGRIRPAKRKVARTDGDTAQTLGSDGGGVRRVSPRLQGGTPVEGL